MQKQAFVGKAWPIILALAAFVFLAFEFSGSFFPGFQKSRSDECLHAQSRLACWEGKLSQILASGDIGAAFSFVADAAKQDPLVSGDCHSFVHEIGQAAYAEFSKNKKIDIPQEASMCAYGFYHGFMEALLVSGVSLGEAQKFCNTIGESSKYPGTRSACFHGIGHGLATPHEAGAKENPDAMILSALHVCDAISTSSLDLYLCSSGVFNAIEILQSSHQYGLSVDASDPFAICRIQATRFQNACYTNMIPAVLSVTINSVQGAVSYLDSIPNQSYAADAMVALAAEEVHLEVLPDMQHNTAYAAEFCYAIAAQFRIPCIRGLVVGFMKYGMLQKEYENALALCRSNALHKEERSACFEQLLGNEIFVYYPLEKAKTICSSVEEEYKEYCSRHL